MPLGGNRKGRVRTYVNLFLVMLLGGLWHGAAWNFVIWGALHGALLAFERLRGKAALYGGLPAPVRVGVTFTLVLVTWVFFRAADLPHAFRYLGDMWRWAIRRRAPACWPAIVYQPYYLGTFLLAGAIVWSAPQTWDWTRTLTLPKAAAVAGRLRVVGGGAGHAGLQPVHLFHFLMSTPEQPLPAGGTTARRSPSIEIEHTTVSPATVRLLLAFFLTAIAVRADRRVAGVRVRGAARASPVAWSHLSELPGEIRARSPRRQAAARTRACGSRIVSDEPDRARRTERVRARAGERIAARAVAAAAGAARDDRLARRRQRARLSGRDGWLFYRPDVEYITGRGFLDPAQLRRRVAGGA